MDRPVLITGASGGLGVALTEHLLAAGWRNLICHYRTRPARIAATLSRFGLDPAARLLQADLTNEAQLADLHDRLRESFGPLFGLVNLVGASSNRMSWKMDRREFQEILDANLLSAFLTCKEFIPEMREQQQGRLINISSVVAFTGVSGAAHYCAAKAGVIGLSKSLALELAPKNVTVSVLALGYFDVGLIEAIPHEVQEQIKSRIPSGRFGRGDEAGGLIEYLLSEAGAYSTGQVYHLNGGLYS
jgi:3-oxoacyl-[acyl-carrier protein] reductase